MTSSPAVGPADLFSPIFPGHGKPDVVFCFGAESSVLSDQGCFFFFLLCNVSCYKDAL